MNLSATGKSLHKGNRFTSEYCDVTSSNDCHTRRRPRSSGKGDVACIFAKVGTSSTINGTKPEQDSFVPDTAIVAKLPITRA